MLLEECSARWMHPGHLYCVSVSDSSTPLSIMINQPAHALGAVVRRKRWRHECYWWVEQKPRCSVRVTEKDALADLTCHQINNPSSTHARTHASYPPMIDRWKVRFEGRVTVGPGRAGMCAVGGEEGLVIRGGEGLEGRPPLLHTPPRGEG